MPWFKYKGEMMPDFIMLEAVPSPVRAEQSMSIIEMPDNIPIAYQTNQFKTTTITINIGFKIGVSDMNFFNKYLNLNLKHKPENEDDISDEEQYVEDLTASEIENYQFSSVYSWLCETGALTFSNDSDKYYQAICNSQIVPERVSRRIRKLPVQFTLMPFRYSVDNDAVNCDVKNRGDGYKETWIRYDGTYPALPTIKFTVSGTGDLYLKWGLLIDITITNVTNFVTIDVNSRRVYDHEGNVILNKTSGDILSLTLEKDTYIKLSSNVTKVEAVLNKRWR